MPAAVALKVNFGGVTQYADATKKMSRQTETILVAAINRSMEMAYTQVKKSLSTQMGIAQGKIESGSRGLRLARASKGHLQASIVARSDWTPLGYFNPVQFKSGVKASGWRQRVLYRGTFTLGFKSGYTGVFKRVGPGRRVKKTRINPKTGRPNVYYSEVGGVEQLWGPSLQREMQRFPTPEIFHDTIAATLPRRVEHETLRVFGMLAKKPSSRR